MTPDEMREYVTSAPLPGEGVSPWDRDDLERGIDPDKETCYSVAARSAAHALLVLCEEDPSLLGDLERGIDPDKETCYSVAARSATHALLVLCEEDPSLLGVPSKEDDPGGFERADNRKLWDAMQARWPEGDRWLGGISGFQYGWAHNAVRYILGCETVGNPAILTVGSA